MDRENANFQKAVDSLRETLTGSTILPLHRPSARLQLPLVFMKAYMGVRAKKRRSPTTCVMRSKRPAWR